MYTDEKNAQIVVALLKEHGIKKIIVSPGTTNIAFSMSVQNDTWFEVYSCVDERAAAYMACGLSAESNEPVVISCTGATASQNYIPGLTEAYYRKLPVLAIMSSQPIGRVGHNMPQVSDRSVLPNDCCRVNVSLPIVKDKEDWWECEIKVNQAINALRKGSAVINLPTTYSTSFTTKKLPKMKAVRVVKENLPEITAKTVGVFIGEHKPFTKTEEDYINKFCRRYNSVVFCDHTSNYNGNFKVQFSVASSQLVRDFDLPELIIHIGGITGDYYNSRLVRKEVWRVDELGEIKDTFKGLTHVFEMSVGEFFKSYYDGKEYFNFNFYGSFLDKVDELRHIDIELPFSNIWIAQKLSPLIPRDSVVHFGILNSLRSWNFFELFAPAYCNVGGFGIDGCLPSFIGASLANPDKQYYLIIGDLSFFYGLNVLGNKHVGNNLHILLVNNGGGTEFKMFNHVAHVHKDTDLVSAHGHHNSPDIVRHVAEDFGFKYLVAQDKEQFLDNVDRFLGEGSVLLEAFVYSNDESRALKEMLSLNSTPKKKVKNITKRIIKKIKK